MIKLDEGDIRGVARNRFYRKHIKYMVGYLLVIVGSLIIGSLLKMDPLVWFALVILIVGFILWYKGENKAVKALVEEWKESGI